MARRIPVGLRTGEASSNTAGWLLPPKLIEDDRRSFLAAGLLASRRSGRVDSCGWWVSVTYETCIALARCKNWTLGLLRWVVGLTTEQRSETLVAELRRLRYEGDFFLADKRIRSAPSKLLSKPAVAAAAAHLYLDFGHVSAARSAIDASTLPSAIETPGWIYEEHIVVLALVSLAIDVQRTLDFQVAIHVLENIDAVYVRLDCSDEFQFGAARIRSHRLALDSEPQQGSQEGWLVLEAALLVEYWSITLRLLFIQEGYSPSDQSLTRRALQLIRHLRSRNLKSLETDAVLLLVQGLDVLANSKLRLELMDELYDMLSDSDWQLRGQLRLSQIELVGADDSAGSSRLLNDAKEIYARAGSQPGLLCAAYEDLRLSTTKTTQSMVEVLIQQSDDFVSQGMVSNSMSCLFEALCHIQSYPELWRFSALIETRFMSQVNATQNQLTGEKFRHLQQRVGLGNTLTPTVWYARNILETYLEKYPGALTPRLEADVLTDLASCYESLGDLAAARTYVGQLSSSLAARHNPALRSSARRHLARLVLADASIRFATATDGAKDDHSRDLRVLKEEIGVLTTLNSEDIQEGRVGAVRQNESLIKAFCDLIRSNWADEDCDGTTAGASTVVTGDVGEGQASTDRPKESFNGLADLDRLIRKGEFLEAVRQSSSWLEALKSDATTSSSDIAYAYHVCATAHTNVVVSAVSQDDKLLHLDKGIELYETCMSLIKETSNSDLYISIAFSYLVLLDRCIQAYPAQHAKRVPQALQYIYTVDHNIRQFRAASSDSAGIKMTLVDRAFSATAKISRFYKTAVWFCLSQRCYWEAWHLVQMGRGIALLNTLLRSSSFELIKKIVYESPKLRKLILEAVELNKKYLEKPFDDRGPEKEAYHRRIRDMTIESPVLAEMLNLGDQSRPVSQSDLPKIASIIKNLSPGTNVYHIDWYIMPQAPFRIVLFMTNILESTLKLGTLNMTLSDIADWKQTYLIFPTDRTKPLTARKGALKRLEQLVSALANVVKKGDLLILTPPAELASIPIHAIPVAGVPMIERHTVVYSTSLSLYNRCLVWTMETSGTPERSLSKAAFTAAYEEDDESGLAERAKIFETVKLVTQKARTSETILGSDLTRQAMENVLQSKCWIHYHGHAQYSKSDALNQGLVLSDGNSSNALVDDPSRGSRIGAVDHHTLSRPSVDETTMSISIEQEKEISAFLKVAQKDTNALSSTLDSTPPSQTTRELVLSDLLPHTTTLTVKTVFTLDLRQHHPFICLIACESGLLDISAGDEPLGMLSALFCQGASGAIGTLWPIESSVGRIFTQHYYQALFDQVQASEETELAKGTAGKAGGQDKEDRVLDLATAFQVGVRAVRRERDDPYAWAAFVLHGSGFYFY